VQHGVQLHPEDMSTADVPPHLPMPPRGRRPPPGTRLA
jgi:hypothetical protein